MSSLLVHASRSSLARCSVSPRRSLSKVLSQTSLKTNELTGKSKFRRWDNTFDWVKKPPTVTPDFDSFSFSGTVLCAVKNYNVELLQLELMRLSQVAAAPSHIIFSSFGRTHGAAMQAG